MTNTEIKFEKDEANERPVPTGIRSTISSVVDAFVKKDYSLSNGVAGVAAVSEKTANHINEYITDYGEVLVQLHSDTWNSSVCMWSGSHWDLFIDLWTASEGRSDLVLGAKVTESDNGYIIDIGMVYVP